MGRPAFAYVTNRTLHIHLVLQARFVTDHIPVDTVKPLNLNASKQQALEKVAGAGFEPATFRL